jgi:cytochrome c biogenesis protein CcmG/thiol:disulfide interchange protein DsbE
VKHGVRWLCIGVGVVVVVLGVVLALTVGSDPQDELNRSALVGKPVPAFRVKSLDGTTVSDTDIRGTVTIVNFWNTWCAPCRDELRALRRFASQLDPSGGVQVLGVVRDAREPESVIAHYVDAERMKWTIALDPRGRAALDFATRGQPETFATSPSGMVVGAKIGPVSTEDLQEMVEIAQRAG